MIDFSSVTEPIKEIDWHQFTKQANQAIPKKGSVQSKTLKQLI